MKERFISNLKVYVNFLPYSGIIIGVFAFIYAYFFSNKELAFAFLYAFIFFIVHLLVWIPARLVLKNKG